MIFSIFLACSLKSGVTMMKAERVYQEKNTQQNRSAVYEWTMAESYLHKAKEEYADSSFEEAEKLAEQAIEWMVRSEETAKLKASENSENLQNSENKE